MRISLLLLLLTLSVSIKGAKDITVNGNEIYITGDVWGTVSFGDKTVTENNKGVFTLKITDNDKAIKTGKELQVNPTLFNVYPNPTGSVFTVSYNGEQTSPVTISIKNELGQIILIKEYSEQKELLTTFDLSHLAKGVYFIQLSTNEAIEVKKIVLE